MTFITAFLLYAINLLVCRDVFSYRSLFRITAYAQTTLLVAWIPGMALIAGLWKFYLIYLGIAMAGPVKPGRAFVSLIATAGLLLAIIQLLKPVAMS